AAPRAPVRGLPFRCRGHAPCDSYIGASQSRLKRCETIIRMAYGDLSRLRRHPGYPLFYATATLTRFADEMFSVGVVLLVLHPTGTAVRGGAIAAAATRS